MMKNPGTWLELPLLPYPSGAGSLFRWGTRPLANTSRFVEGRIKSIASIDRSMSDAFGSTAVATARITVQDDDGQIRALFASMANQHFENVEAAIKQLSDEGANLNLVPRFYMRGLVTSYKPQSGRLVDFDLSDFIGSSMSPLNLDKVLGIKLTRGQHSALPFKNLDKIYPMYMGEHSDRGAYDISGNPADVGMMPLIDCGDYSIGAAPSITPGTFDPGWVECGYNGWGAGTIPPGHVFTFFTVLRAGVESNVSRGFDFLASIPSPAFQARFQITGAFDFIRLYFTDSPAFDPFLNRDAGTFVRYHDITNLEAPTGVNPYGGTTPFRYYLVDSLTWGSDFKTGAATKATPPRTLTATIMGTAGTTSHTYGVTAFTSFGETLFSNIVTIATSPDALSAVNYVKLDWIAPQYGAATVTGYRIWGRRASSGTPPKFLKALAGVLTYNDTGVDGESAPPSGAGEVNTATSDGSIWGRMLVKIGPMPPHLGIYASNLNTNATPKRARVADSQFGISKFVLTPDDVGWPYVNRTLTFDGIEASYILVRGPYLAAHRDGSVTMAMNGGGDMQNAAVHTSNIIDQAFYALQHFLNEYVAKNGGLGYRTGIWGPLEQFSNGDSIFQTSAFTAAQNVSIARIGNLGYLAAWSITEQTTLREFLRWFCITFCCRVGAKHHGQFFPLLINDLASATVGRLYQDRVDVDKLDDPGTLAWDEIETETYLNYDYSTDRQDFRVKNTPIYDSISRAAHRRLITRSSKSPVECRCSRDRATVVDAHSRRLAWCRQVPRYSTFTTDLTGLENDLGTQIRLTHYDGAGDPTGLGDVKTPMVVLSHTILPGGNNQPDRVKLTCLDLSRILGTFPGV